MKFFVLFLPIVKFMSKSQVMAVSDEVVPLVNINAIGFVGDNLSTYSIHTANSSLVT